MKNVSSILAIPIIFIFFFIACDSWVGIKGVVYDEQNKPIENATVQISIAGAKDDIWKRTIRTDKDGNFSLHLGVSPWSSDLRLTAAKDGYEIFQTDVTSSQINKNESNYNNYTIVLKKLVD